MNEEMEAEPTNSMPKSKLTPLFVYILNRDHAALIISIISVVIALASISIVVYREFLESYNVSVNFDQIVVLRLPKGNQYKIINDIMINGIISGNDEYLDEKYYKGNPNALKKYPDIVDAAKRKDKARLSELFANLKITKYKPADKFIRKYIGIQALTPRFCIPMTIANSGSKFAHINRLYLIITNKNEEKEKWLFICTHEIKIDLIHQKGKKDSDRIKQIFSGTSIGPKKSIIATPAFGPLWDIDGKEIASNSMAGGTYKFKIVGYSRESKKIFEARIDEFPLAESTLLKMFQGTDTSILLEQNYLEKKLIGFKE